MANLHASDTEQQNGYHWNLYCYYCTTFKRQSMVNNVSTWQMKCTNTLVQHTAHKSHNNSLIKLYDMKTLLERVTLKSQKFSLTNLATTSVCGEADIFPGPERFWRSVMLTRWSCRNTKCSACAEEKLPNNRPELRLQVTQNDIAQVWVVLRHMNLKLNTYVVAAHR